MELANKCFSLRKMAFYVVCNLQKMKKPCRNITKIYRKANFFPTEFVSKSHAQKQQLLLYDFLQVANFVKKISVFNYVQNYKLEFFENVKQFISF